MLVGTSLLYLSPWQQTEDYLFIFLLMLIVVATLTSPTAITVRFTPSSRIVRFTPGCVIFFIYFGKSTWPESWFWLDLLCSYSIISQLVLFNHTHNLLVQGDFHWKSLYLHHLDFFNWYPDSRMHISTCKYVDMHTNKCTQTHIHSH